MTTPAEIPLACILRRPSAMSVAVVFGGLSLPEFFWRLGGLESRCVGGVALVIVKGPEFGRVAIIERLLKGSD